MFAHISQLPLKVLQFHRNTRNKNEICQTQNLRIKYQIIIPCYTGFLMTNDFNL